MLKLNEVNPLTVFGLRMMDHCPPHFVQVSFETYTNEKQILDWIWENTQGRFYFGDIYQPASNGSITFQKCAAFEIPGEASYFSLLLSSFNTRASLY